MENTNQENVIYFRDVLFSALHRWRAGLLAALILAGLLGGYTAVSGWSAITTPPDPQVYAAQLEQYEASLQILTETAAKQQKSIESQQEYMTNSVLMGLDPFDHYRVKFSVYADTDFPVSPNAAFVADKTAYILSAYFAKFSSTETAGILAQAVGTEALYMSELCTVEIPEASALVTVTIVYPTQEGAELLLAQLNTQFELFREDLNKNIFAHNAQVLESSVGRAADPELVQKQVDADTYLQELIEAQAQTKADFGTLVPPTSASGSRSSFIKKVLLMTILGAIAGYGLVAVYGWIELITSQKVFSSRALRIRTGVKVIGCCSTKNRLNPVDRLVFQLEGRDVTPAEDRAAVLARDVLHRCGDAASLLVTGDMDEKRREFFLEALKQAMPGVQVVDQGSILRRAGAVDGLDSCDKVLLVEQCGSSRYNNIAAQCQKIEDYSKEILGCILLDG